MVSGQLGGTWLQFVSHQSSIPDTVPHAPIAVQRGIIVVVVGVVVVVEVVEVVDVVEVVVDVVVIDSKRLFI